MKSASPNPFLKVSAFLFPYIFVFYGPLHDNAEKSYSKVLWNYILGGFLMYAVVTIIISLIM